MKYVRDFGPVAEYGPDYYTHYYGREGPSTYSRENPAWLTFFGYVADEVVKQLGPRTALDVGCAKGFLVECLRDRGVEACGFDISDYAISEVRSDVKPYCWVGSAASAINKDYDLITCLEVCEHLPESEAHEAVRQMTSHADTILFSSTPSDFAEPTHVNVHPIIDWLRLFAQFSFAPDGSFDAGCLAPWAVLFRRAQLRPSDQVLCQFANVRNQAIARAEIEQELAAKNALLYANSSILRKIYRNVRFRAKHPIAQALRKLNLIR
jgi:SAM-dependent methyltransferase